MRTFVEMVIYSNCRVKVIELDKSISFKEEKSTYKAILESVGRKFNEVKK